MTFESYQQIILNDPTALVQNGLRFVHFIGLALGLGGATLLDLMLFRFFLRRPITPEAYSIFVSSTRVVDLGLRILWLTGLGFLVFYALTDPGKLANPKVHAKFVIVTILTLNGIFIHRAILPVIGEQVGRSLFDGVGALRRTVFSCSAAISVTSWYVPVALGVFSQLNNTVPAVEILAAYALLMVVTVVIINCVMALLVPRCKVPQLVPGE
ncbi:MULTISPECIES: hypothetical protein [unclassified Roseovarius]|uniref:hypothetical protein n=1 Tax=unclassified Roseovarius TaxID=2614913 RepID=UPI00273F4608|nr:MULTISPECIES: hypothetical protein [unclassified Roseovarius]